VDVCISLTLIKHERSQSQPSKYAIEKNSGGVADVKMDVPQFEMQPFFPAAAVPGALVVELEMVQNSVVVLSKVSGDT